MWGWMSTIFDCMQTTSMLRSSGSRVRVDEQLVNGEHAGDELLLEGVEDQRLNAALIDREPIGQRVVADHLHQLEIARRVLADRLAVAQLVDIAQLRFLERIEHRLGEPWVRFQDLVLDD